MDRKYKLPRLKYKGDPEANAQWVRDASKRAGVEEATAGDKWKAARTKATMALGCVQIKSSTRLRCARIRMF